MILRALFRFPSEQQAKRRLALDQVLAVRKSNWIPRLKQWRYLPRLLSRTEKRLLGIGLLLVIVSGSVLTYQAVFRNPIITPAVGGAYTEGVIGSPQFINPLYAVSSDVDSDFTALVFSGLMRFDTATGLGADLASSYTVSEDGKVYEFTIRDDAFFHDGKPVTAGDVLFTFNAIQNPEYNSPLAQIFRDVTVEQTSDTTIRFTLEDPFAPFLSYLTVGILPSHLWSGIAPVSALTTALNQRPIGSGPYAFEKLRKDTNGTVHSYEFKRHNRYHLGQVYLERLEFKFYGTQVDATEALRNGNVQGLAYIPAGDAEAFKKNNAVTIATPTIPQYTALFFNQKKNTLLADKTIRTALANATNKQALVDNALKGFAQPTNSFILENMLGYTPDLVAPTFNTDTASALLAEKGWTITEGNAFRVKGTDTLKFVITTVNVPELTSVAEELKKQWALAGIDVVVNPVSSTELQTSVLKERNYEILLSGELYGFDADPYAFWHSSQTAYPNLNLAQFANREADTAIEKGRVATTVEARAEAYRSLQTIITNELPAIFLYQPFYTYPHDSKITTPNLEHIGSPSNRFGNIFDWYTKTKRSFFKQAKPIVDAPTVL